MSLKPEVTAEEFSTLDPTEKSFYKEVKSTVTEDGSAKEIITYVPDIEGVGDTGNLLNALEERKKEAASLKKSLKEMEKTVNELKGLKHKTEQEKALAEQKKMEEEGKYKELLELTRRQAEEEKQEYDKILKQKEEMFNKVVLDKEVKSWAVTHGGIIPERLDQFFKLYRDRFELDSEGNILCKDEKGNYNNLPMEKQFELLRNDAPWAVRSDRKGGGGNQQPGFTQGHNGSNGFINIAQGSRPVLEIDKDTLQRMKNGSLEIKGFNVAR